MKLKKFFKGKEHNKKDAKSTAEVKAKSNVSKTASKGNKPEKTAKNKNSWEAEENAKNSTILEKTVADNPNNEKDNSDPMEFVIEDEDLRAKKKPLFKPTVDQKLTILLIENSTEMEKEKDKLVQIVKSLTTSEGYFSIINYGSTVRQTEPMSWSKIDLNKLLNAEDISDNKCLYEALLPLEDMVFAYNKKLIEEEDRKLFIDRIDIIGIGSCTDVGSKVSKTVATACFARTVRISSVSTKYFCFSDATFVDAASIGFRSIGAINRNYKDT